MFGILLAVLSALFFAFGDVGKKTLSARFHPYLVNWIPVTAGVGLGAIFFGTQGTPPVSGGSLVPLAVVSGILLFFVELAFLRSIRDAEISLVMPLSAFVPIVSGAIAWVAFDEAPSNSAFLGIAIIVLASWLMFAEARDWRQIIRPFQRMVDDPAARFMLLFSVLNGIFVNIMNVGGDRSSGLFFLWLVLIAEWLLLSTMLVIYRLNPVRAAQANLRGTLLTGLFWALGMASFFESLSHTLVAYAMAAKCTHTIFIVVLGYYVFGDHEVKKRLGASLILLAGLCILFLGH